MPRKYEWAAQDKPRARRNGVLKYANACADGTQKPSKVDPVTCERDYRPDELEFMFAMHAYILRTGRKFPTWSETLSVLKSLGYSKSPPEGP